MASTSMFREKPKVTVTQLRILLDAIERDPSLYNARGSDMITLLNIEKWHDLTDKLNDTYPEGALLVPTSSWKYVLRYWCENTKKKMNRDKPHKTTLPLEEAKELADLEKRLYEFIKIEDAKEIVDVTYMSKFDNDNENPNADSFKFVVQLHNVFSTEPNENTTPDGPKKRTIIMKEDDETDTSGKTKKFKIIFDQNVDNDNEEPEKQILENHLDRLQVVSRDLEEHISTIQSRIHMIKDLWKHRCGDN